MYFGGDPDKEDSGWVGEGWAAMVEDEEEETDLNMSTFPPGSYYYR